MNTLKVIGRSLGIALVVLGILMIVWWSREPQMTSLWISGVIIGLILWVAIRPWNTSDHPINGEDIWKIFAVILIVIIWGFISCGGNIILFIISAGSMWENGLSALGPIFIFWFIELFWILVYAIWRMFYKKPELAENKSNEIS